MVGEFSKLVGKRRIVVKEEDCLFSDLKEEESETVFIYFSKMNGQRGRSRKSLSLSNSSSQGKKKDLEDGSSDAGRKLSTSSHSGHASCGSSAKDGTRHLFVVEKGEVVAILDMVKCLYNAIARMERVAEKGKAIAAAFEGVEKQWGTSISGPNTFIETLRE